MSSSGELAADMPSVEDVIDSLRNFGLGDYGVFVSMLLGCGCIGAYFGFVKRSRGEAEYLVGGRNMKTFPVSMSLIASFISGISLLGMPTEIYVHGTSYLCIGLGVVIVGFIMSGVYLPVFHDLRLTSTYEYLELRFDKRIRILGSVLFAIGIVSMKCMAILQHKIHTVLSKYRVAPYSVTFLLC
jgi:Na+/proline symporter